MNSDRRVITPTALIVDPSGDARNKIENKITGGWDNIGRICIEVNTVQWAVRTLQDITPGNIKLIALNPATPLESRTGKWSDKEREYLLYLFRHGITDSASIVLYMAAFFHPELLIEHRGLLAHPIHIVAVNSSQRALALIHHSVQWLKWTELLAPMLLK